MKLLILLFLPMITPGQNVLTGTVINKTTKEIIPYATIGLIKQKTGTNADEQGKFELTITNNKDDSLRISSTGYETLLIPVSNWPVNMQFELEKKQIILKDVIISTNKKTEVLDDFSNCGTNYYISSGSITQIAKHFHVPEDNTLLSEINICKEGANCRFRIHVYGRDTITGKPSGELTDEIIEVKSSKRHVNIDLEKYNIIIPGNDFFIAIEWLYISLNAYKVKSTLEGRKKFYYNYNPAIAIKEKKVEDRSPEKENEVWFLQFDGKWKTIDFFGINRIFLVSATVKY